MALTLTSTHAVDTFMHQAFHQIHAKDSLKRLSLIPNPHRADAVFHIITLSPQDQPHRPHLQQWRRLRLQHPQLPYWPLRHRLTVAAHHR